MRRVVMKTDPLTSLDGMLHVSPDAAIITLRAGMPERRRRRVLRVLEQRMERSGEELEVKLISRPRPRLARRRWSTGARTAYRGSVLWMVDKLQRMLDTPEGMARIMALDERLRGGPAPGSTSAGPHVRAEASRPPRHDTT